MTVEELLDEMVKELDGAATNSGFYFLFSSSFLSVLLLTTSTY